MPIYLIKSRIEKSQHAPSGGQHVNGKEYKGGQFVPNVPDVNIINPVAETKIGRGLEVARMLQPLEVKDLFNSNKVSIEEAKKIGQAYYKKELAAHPISCPAFNWSLVKFTDLGYLHVIGEHSRELHDDNIKRRLKLLPKVKAALETTAFVDEIRHGEDGTTEYGLVGRFADGGVIRIVVKELQLNNRVFLSVFDWEDVSKKIKREFHANPLSKGSVTGVCMAPPDFLQDDITKSVFLCKSKNNIHYFIMEKPMTENDAPTVAHPMYLLRKAARTLQGNIDFNGLQISIETGRSRTRNWYNPQDGSSGMSLMRLPYGYIKGTLGVDGDHVDCFVGANREAKEVYVVHTIKAPDFTEYDEDKCFIGLDSAEDAKREFHHAYNDPRFFGSMSVWPFEEFKEKVLTTRDNPQMLKKSGEAMCKQLGDSMGIDWKKYDLDEFCDGMFVEEDHKDVVSGDSKKIARIVIEHLDEDPKYYSHLKKVKKMGLIKSKGIFS